MSLYISTICLKQKMDLSKMLDLFKRLNLKNVELGVWEKVDRDCLELLKKNNFNFIVHHYFPPPKKPFIINLASSNKEILERSINQIKKSIDFCSSLNIDLFSFHAGFRIDPTGFRSNPNASFKFDLNKGNIPNHEKSFKIFKESVKKIVKYAELKNIKIAIENNVVAEYDLINRQNKILLMTELWEFERLFKEISSGKLGILLDLGHLKVTSNLLGFDRYNFIDKLKNKIFAIHSHENNGRVDQHKELKENSWCFEVIDKWFKNKKIPLVMESRYSNIEELINNKNLIEKSIKYKPKNR